MTYQHPAIANSAFSKPVKRLQELLPDFREQLFDSRSLARLTETLIVKHDFPYNEKILALLPVKEAAQLCQLVITEEDLYLVDRTQDELLSQACQFHTHVPFDHHFKNALNQVLNRDAQNYNLPMPTWRYVLMPLKTSSQWAGSRLWLNPEILLDIHKKPADSCWALHTVLGLTLRSPVIRDTLYGRLELACLCHGLLLRMHEVILPRNADKLQTFLGYPSLPLVNRVLEDLKFRHIPGERDELMKKYSAILRQHERKTYIDAEERALARSGG